jgi:hypothetical protein
MLSFQELEDLVARSVCEVMSGRSEIGSLRLRVDLLEDNVTRWRDKALDLARQVKDVTTVVYRFNADARAAKATGARVEPVVIARSVGLQVGVGLTNTACINGNRSDHLSAVSTLKNQINEAQLNT